MKKFGNHLDVKLEVMGKSRLPTELDVFLGLSHNSAHRFRLDKYQPSLLRQKNSTSLDQSS